MPTGYTAGIIDGEITTFQQFAKLCARAFGATIHMRDEPLKKEFEPRTPSDYHTKEIEKAKGSLALIKAMSDEEIVYDEKNLLTKRRDDHLKSIQTIKANWEKLNAILLEAENWEPPTSEHTGIKEFMIQQLNETIRYDAGTSYHDGALVEIEQALNNMTAPTIKEKRIFEAKKNILYHTTEHQKELERCAQANKWVEEYFDSLNYLATQ